MVMVQDDCMNRAGEGKYLMCGKIPNFQKQKNMLGVECATVGRRDTRPDTDIYNNGEEITNWKDCITNYNPSNESDLFRVTISYSITLSLPQPLLL